MADTLHPRPVELVSAGDRATVTGRTVHRLDLRGMVRDWLIGPAWVTPCDDLDTVLDRAGSPWQPDGRWVLTNGPDVSSLKERLYRRRPLVLQQRLPEPLEGETFQWTGPGGEPVTGVWRRYHTLDDGMVDWTVFSPTPTYRHAVAATVLEVDQSEWRTLVFQSTGPVAIWVGGEMVGHFTDVSYMDPIEHAVRLRLPSGTSAVIVATWQVAFRECRHVVGLRIEGLPVRVVVPSPGADEFASAVAEDVLDAVGVTAWALRDEVVHLVGPGDASLVVGAEAGGTPQTVRLVDGRAAVPVAALLGDRPASGESDAEPSPPSMLASGAVTLRVRFDADHCPVERRLRVAVLPRTYRAAPVGEPARWRQELLEHVAAGPPSSARALARSALGSTEEVGEADLEFALTMLDARADCADFEALGLLHLWHRISVDRWPPGLRRRVRDALLGFKYWIEEPGLDAMCYFTENHQLVWHTVELLAGEAFRDDTFANAGWSGSEHAAHGRALAVEWMRHKLAGGFSEFDSNAYVAIDCLALVSLVEFAVDTDVRRLAEALLDKLLLTLASNSWRGIHGAAHGRSYLQMVRSARFEETGPIMWTLWGAGALNHAVLPGTAIATATSYSLPALIRSVAWAAEPWEGRQVYRGRYSFQRDLLARPYGSDLRVWRTAEVMLSSVQDYRPGLPGLQEHVWAATLGPEVQIFATHPANASHDSAVRPNAWAGQRILPRARQHRDSLLVVHGIPEGDPVSETHLWFPVALVDEWVRSGPWLAARVGDGYVAVAADGGLEPVTHGDEAYQSWRSRAGGRAYVATVGGRSMDGSFGEFLARLRPPAFESRGPKGPAVAWTTRDGRELALAWTGPFTVNGQPTDIGPDGRPEMPAHIDNPATRTEFGAERLVALHGGHRLVLDLVRGRRIEPRSGIAGQ